jgi:hypothetical protein
MMTTTTQAVKLKSSNWVTATATNITPHLNLGWQASNATPFSVLGGLFVSYDLLTSAGKAFVGSSKMETNTAGSLRRTTMADVLRSKFQCCNLSEM